MNEAVLGPNVIRQSVMMEAEGLVNGARAAAYGHPKENFERICWLWNAYLKGRPDHEGNEINEKDHAILMILVKIARLQETPDHRDSLVDICGYAGTYEKLLQREQEDALLKDAQYEELAVSLAEDTKPARYKCCKHCFDDQGVRCETSDQHYMACTRGCEC